MQVLEKHPELPAILAKFEIFEGVEPTAIQWFIDHSEYQQFEEGEYLFRADEEAKQLVLITKGEYLLRMQQSNEFRDLGYWGAGFATGLLPFSRMKKTTAYGIAQQTVELLALPRSCFAEMVTVSYELTQNLVGVMSSRIKTFTEQRLQDEKLMSLGKLSAGLAHELNNPASALVRSADELYHKIHQSPERFKSVITMRVTSEETDALNAILFSKAQQGPIKELGLMERESCKDDILDWLEDHDIDNADDIAETFLDFGLRLEDMEAMKEALNGKELDAMMWWIESTLSLERLVKEIRESADRIGRLVNSVKTYTHMDQSQDMQSTDLHEGIRSTMIMLKHQFKEKSIQVVKEFAEDMPMVCVHPGEMNQVWTNLIDNAVDAAPEGGMLKVRTYVKNEKAVVDIIDNGPGIPEVIRNKIFDPFFTTKEIGKGTGMGLEIARRIVLKHHGEISVKSKPGETIFTVCIPI
ncbi:MAG TPA: ATP-binding protein [Haliscomenobacter sp.]|uniref:ATP-binding protein n=1 Tax=Haliscomenobacter sp. TaxID=2717303 RepID=UPI002B5CB661|nr:ATP-binding protein [Haliscomenobacter sp.]HOY19595.1 ATP-binding protein [Haliscomenobacter sp.]